MKDFIRKITPQSLLNWNRQRKKKWRERNLEKQREAGNAVTWQNLLDQLKEIGIEEGDTLLVHSSLSRIGFLEEGPKTLVDALLEAVGPEGNILMPTSPNNVYQLDYIRSVKNFDVLNSPSKTGAITEYFRKLPGALRSLHPTEPVSALGPKAAYFTEEHFGQLTPYNKKSPFYKVSKEKGKILYIGVTLDMAGTNLHTLEDAVDFKFPVYYPEEFEVEVIDAAGNSHHVKTKVHNPEFSKKRRCDELIPLFEKRGVLRHVKIGQADTLLLDASAMFEVMIDEYTRHGVTMYTPTGS